MLAFVAALVLSPSGATPAPDYTTDLDTLLTDLKTDGAYVREDAIDLTALDREYRPRFAAARTRGELLPVLEALVGELHDPHAGLGTNDDASPRLIPSGTDLMGIWRGERESEARAFAEEVRPGSLAAEAGIAPGDEIVAIGGEPVRRAAARWLGVVPPGTRGWEWALNSALAGRWNAPRRLTLRRGATEREVTLATARDLPVPGRLTVTRRPGAIVVLRPNDSLGDDALIRDIEATLPDLRAARGIVLDLRDTPSGGNTTVARGILGLFLSRRLPYQRHHVEERATDTVRDWVEYATPRLKASVRAPLLVLVDRWTGSMGEGLAVGFDATRRATVVGTRMAGLRGAIAGTTLPVSGIRVQFPTEALFHPNGTPRHLWLPPVRVTPGPGDPWMTRADRILRR